MALLWVSTEIIKFIKCGHFKILSAKLGFTLFYTSHTWTIQKSSVTRMVTSDVNFTPNRDWKEAEFLMWAHIQFGYVNALVNLQIHTSFVFVHFYTPWGVFSSTPYYNRSRLESSPWIAQFRTILFKFKRNLQPITIQKWSWAIRIGRGQSWL